MISFPRVPLKPCYGPKYKQGGPGIPKLAESTIPDSDNALSVRANPTVISKIDKGMYFIKMRNKINSEKLINNYCILGR